MLLPMQPDYSVETLSITHITLSTGHKRESLRSEVADSVLQALAPWLDVLVAKSGRVEFPFDGFRHFSASAVSFDGALVVTVFAPSGPLDVGLLSGAVDGVPLVTFGVALNASHGSVLWDKLLLYSELSVALSMPASPWCGVVVHPSLSLFPDAARWLGDFERCVAWAWVVRNDPRMRTL